MGPHWTQTGVGIGELVHRLPELLRTIVGEGGQLPRVVCSDRGPGLYNTSTGHICVEYSRALKANSFRPFAGEDATWQPPDVPDLLPHETVAAWIRTYFRKHPFQKTTSLERNVANFKAVLHACEMHINANYRVDELCEAFPSRIGELTNKAKGGRLKH